MAGSTSRGARWKHHLTQWGPWLVLLVAGFYLYRTVYPPIELARPGRPAPDFAAPALDGSTFRLAEHRGQILVLNVWATWCAPCRLEMPGFVDLQRRFRDEGVRFVGLNVDRGGLAAIRDFAAAHDLNYPQVDGRRVVARHFPGRAIPRTYLIDRRGRIRFRHEGLIMEGALENGIEALLAESAP